MANNENQNVKNVPIGKNEVVEYKSSLADVDDLEAVQRAHAADQRQENNRTEST